MGQKKDADFTIMEDGTIVRGSKSSKVNQMKKKVSSDNSGNRTNIEKNSNRSLRWIVLLAIIGVIIGGVFILNGGAKDSTSFYSSDSSRDDLLQESDNELQIAEVEEFQTRSISCKTGDANHLPYCEIIVDYPAEGSRSLVNEVRFWINHVLNKYIYGKSWSGSLEEGGGVIKFYAENSLDVWRVFEINFRKEFESSHFVTFEYSIYLYDSGAVHGENRSGGATFRKTDGQIIDWDMFIDDTDMREIIKTGIYEYLGDDDYDKDYSSLPECNPIFLRNGVKFLYEHYEIKGTLYADGEPSFTIPYSEIKYQMKSSLRDIIY